MERRRVHVRVAIADSRIEGIATSAAELEIFEAYIRGEIEAADLVTAYKEGRFKKSAVTVATARSEGHQTPNRRNPSKSTSGRNFVQATIKTRVSRREKLGGANTGDLQGTAGALTNAPHLISD
jgi:hypothetical protein